MNDKDIFELFQNGFTTRNTSDSYNLCATLNVLYTVVNYYPILIEDIHRGIECEKAHAKVITKIHFMNHPVHITKIVKVA